MAASCAFGAAAVGFRLSVFRFPFGPLWPIAGRAELKLSLVRVAAPPRLPKQRATFHNVARSFAFQRKREMSAQVQPWVAWAPVSALKGRQTGGCHTHESRQGGIKLQAYRRWAIASPRDFMLASRTASSMMGSHGPIENSTRNRLWRQINRT
jgi:hypothetical protein